MSKIVAAHPRIVREPSELDRLRQIEHAFFTKTRKPCFGAPAGSYKRPSCLVCEISRLTGSQNYPASLSLFWPTSAPLHFQSSSSALRLPLARRLFETAENFAGLSGKQVDF